MIQDYQYKYFKTGSIKADIISFKVILNTNSSLTCTIAWNQASKKYRRARSFGGFIIRAADTVENVRSRLARTPGGGSYVKMRPARSRLTGKLGLISQVRNRRKCVCA